jgi:hypothetical protein
LIGKPEGGDSLYDLGTDGSVILKMYHKRESVWAGLISLKGLREGLTTTAKTWVRITSASTELPSQDLRNQSPESYCYTILVCLIYVFIKPVCLISLFVRVYYYHKLQEECKFESII